MSTVTQRSGSRQTSRPKSHDFGYGASTGTAPLPMGVEEDPAELLLRLVEAQRDVEESERAAREAMANARELGRAAREARGKLSTLLGELAHPLFQQLGNGQVVVTERSELDVSQESRSIHLPGIPRDAEPAPARKGKRKGARVS